MAKTKDKNAEKVEKKNKRRNQPVPPEITEARQRLAYHLRMVRVPHMNLSEITEELNKQFPSHPLKSDHEAVRKMIERQQKIYAQQDKEKVEEVLAETAAKLDFANAEAMQAWLESKGMTKTVKKKAEQPVEQSMKSTAGDPQYLKIYKETAVDKAKLFGVVAPKKHEVTGAILGNIDLNKLPTTVLQEIAEGGDPMEVILNYVISQRKASD